MTENQVLRLLQRIVAQKRLLKSIKMQLKSLEEIAEPCAADPEKTPVSGGEVEDVSRKLARIERKRERLTKRYLLRVEEILTAETKAEGLVNLIDSEEIRAILMDRYFRGMDWTTIFKEHHASRAKVFRNRKAGIKEMAMKSKKNR